MKRTIRTAIIITLALLAAVTASWASGPDYGASAATAAISGGKAFTIVDMLRWAAEDEYIARGEYEAIMKKFGTMRPYENIMAAEEQHLAWLKAEYKTRGMTFPADGSASHVVVPANLKEAAQAGVDAEIANIKMYETFLARPELAKPENASAKTLFENLKRASENHLRAFRTQLAKY
jgi:hypothetical protein